MSKLWKAESVTFSSEKQRIFNLRSIIFDARVSLTFHNISAKNYLVKPHHVFLAIGHSS